MLRTLVDDVILKVWELSMKTLILVAILSVRCFSLFRTLAVSYIGQNVVFEIRLICIGLFEQSFSFLIKSGPAIDSKDYSDVNVVGISCQICAILSEISLHYLLSLSMCFQLTGNSHLFSNGNPHCRFDGMVSKAYV